MSKKYTRGPHKRIYHFHKASPPPRRESRHLCPDCGAVLAPGKECTCLYVIPGREMGYALPPQ